MGFSQMDIYLLEAVINGILLGGVLALLALGLNLIFGVIDVVWICYAELIMIGMYGMYFLYVTYHLPFVVAALICIAGVGGLGVVLHLVVIQPCSEARRSISCSPPAASCFFCKAPRR